MIKHLRGALGLTVFAAFTLVALAIFLYPVYTAFVKQDALQFIGLFVSWLPAYLVGFIGAHIGSAIIG
jgi:hypothetical protein